MYQSKTYNYSGFTLVEVLIALFIYSIIVSIVSAAIINMLDSSYTSIQDILHFNKLQRALLRLQRDFIQTAKRPITDASNHEHPAFSFPASGKNQVLSFSSYRANTLFPEEYSSNIQRIGYRYDKQKKTLYRVTWPVLDRVNRTYNEKKMLDHIKQLSWKFIDQHQIYYRNWPPATSHRLETLPRAVELILVFDNGEQFEKIFAL